MKHSRITAHALLRAALLSLYAVVVTACLEQPGIIRCDEETGCPARYACFAGRCIQPDVCGNGLVDMGEECDDGNTAAGDECGSACQFEPCGNGLVDMGEECDDGNTVGGDGCSADCTFDDECGNGILDPGEICDDGNNKNRDGCPSSCNYDCEDGASMGYRVCYDLVSWQEARDACLGYGGALVTIANTSENARVGELLPERFWIGLSHSVQDGAFRWVNGSNLSSPVWELGEPNEFDDYDEVCVEAGVAMAHKWADLPCDRLRPFVCESIHCIDCRCGNGRAELDEECDDGNESPGDGCDAACRVEFFPESEPNEDGSPEVSDFSSSEGNDFAIAYADGPYDADAYIAATLEPVGDEDVFMVTNPGSGIVRVRFETHDAAFGQGVSCQAIDTVLFIRDAQGNILTGNDDHQGYCSTVEFEIRPGETVYAHVLAYGDASPILAPGYWLTIDFRER